MWLESWEPSAVVLFEDDDFASVLGRSVERVGMAFERRDGVYFCRRRRRHFYRGHIDTRTVEMSVDFVVPRSSRTARLPRTISTGPSAELVQVPSSVIRATTIRKASMSRLESSYVAYRTSSCLVVSRKVCGYKSLKIQFQCRYHRRCRLIPFVWQSSPWRPFFAGFEKEGGLVTLRGGERFVQNLTSPKPIFQHQRLRERTRASVFSSLWT